MVKLRLGTPGGTERIIFLTSPGAGFYLAIRFRRRYYRLSIRLIPYHYYVGRS